MEEMWQIKAYIFQIKGGYKSHQYTYCQLSRCGYGTVICPYSSDVCIKCRLHLLGCRRDYVNKLLT